mgnify:FL=1
MSTESPWPGLVSGVRNSVQSPHCSHAVGELWKFPCLLNTCFLGESARVCDDVAKLIWLSIALVCPSRISSHVSFYFVAADALLGPRGRLACSVTSRLCRARQRDAEIIPPNKFYNAKVLHSLIMALFLLFFSFFFI